MQSQMDIDSMKHTETNSTPTIDPRSAIGNTDYLSIFSSPSTELTHTSCTTRRNIETDNGNHTNSSTIPIKKPVKQNSFKLNLSSQSLKINELDYIQRKRREERSLGSTLRVDVPAIEQAAFDNPKSVILQNGCTEEDTNDITWNKRRPQFRIRPKVPLPAVKTVHSVIIPSSGIENCKDLADQFPSPHSDRFVLRFPSSAAVAMSENHKNEDEVNLSGKEEPFDAQMLKQNSETAANIAIKPNQFPSVTTTLKNLTLNTNVNPNAFPEFPLDCTDLGRSMSLKPKRPRLSSITTVGKLSRQQKDKLDEEDCLIRSNSLRFSTIRNLKEMEHGALCHKDTNNDVPPPHFETSRPATMLSNRDVGDDDTVTMEVPSREPKLKTSNMSGLPIGSPYFHENGRVMNLKPKRPRLPSSASIINYEEKQQESTDNECENIAMDIDFNISISHENHDNIRAIALNSPQHPGTIATRPVSSPARIHAHDQGSLEIAKEAVLFGSIMQRRSISSGSIAATSPSNMSESNFRTPRQESVKSSRLCWHMRGCSNSNNSNNLLLPSLFSSNSEDINSDIELSIGWQNSFSRFLA